MNRRFASMFVLLMLIGFGAISSSLIAAKTSTNDQQGSASDSKQAPKLGIRLIVKGEVTTTQYPKFFVEFTNNGDKPITLVKPGDGSKWHWRTPLVGWSALLANSDAKHPKATPRFSGPRCGNINPITGKDVITLRPQQSLKFEEWGTRGMFPGAGKYRLVYYYQNVPDHGIKGVPLGTNDAEAIKRIRQSTPVLATSNEVIVTVHP